MTFNEERGSAQVVVSRFRALDDDKTCSVEVLVHFLLVSAFLIAATNRHQLSLEQVTWYLLELLLGDRAR